MDMNNLCGWAMSKKLPVDGFEWVKNTSQFNEDFMKNCNADSVAGYFLDFDVKHPVKLHETHNDLPFLPERMKVGKLKKPLCNLHDKKEYVVHIKT